MASHSATFLDHWKRLAALTTDSASERAVLVDGSSLSIASIVAHARYRVSARLSQSCIPRVQESIDYLQSRISAGDTIYGVNTGLGGNADTRNRDLVQLQRALLLFLNAGVIGWDGDSSRTRGLATPDNANTKQQPFKPDLDAASSRTAQKYPLADTLHSKASRDSMTTLEETSIPVTWVAAAMLVRTNTLAAGNSGISVQLLQSMMRLIQAEIYPVVPLRGSISASGDLQPLSYIAGALAGSPGIKVVQRGKSSDSAKPTVMLPAHQALKNAGLEPVRFGPKEIISIVNGTSVSAGSSALAMHDGHCFAALTQVLTAMAVESLNGSSESFSPFFGEVRPHAGQIECANNVLAFLKGSSLLRGDQRSDWEEVGTMRQDRYALRTAAQWIGPSLEELRLAHEQVEIECNSTTDNPLIDIEGQKIMHGGNFQAMATTAAMDTLRSSLQIWGRMIFAQVTEVINPSYSNGLPPNLTAEDPSRDFLMKGVEIASASYASELGFLAQRVTPHVMSAEMHNQSLNSLALLSTRYTFMALDVYNTLTSTALVVFCQAMDLRAIHHHFIAEFRSHFITILKDFMSTYWPGAQNTVPMTESQWIFYKRELARTAQLDICNRFTISAESVVASLCIKLGIPAVEVTTTGSTLVDKASDSPSPALPPPSHSWARRLAADGMSTWLATRDSHSPERTLPLLGTASRRMYIFVRQRLQIPFLRATMASSITEAALIGTTPDASIGSLISRVFNAARDSSLFVPVVECLKEANEKTVEPTTVFKKPLRFERTGGLSHFGPVGFRTKSRL